MSPTSGESRQSSRRDCCDCAPRCASPATPGSSGRSRLSPTGRERCLQRALFRPRGLLGHAYWYAVSPFHRFIFGPLAGRIIERRHARTDMPVSSVPFIMEPGRGGAVSTIHGMFVSSDEQEQRAMLSEANELRRARGLQQLGPWWHVQRRFFGPRRFTRGSTAATVPGASPEHSVGTTSTDRLDTTHHETAICRSESRCRTADPAHSANTRNAPEREHRSPA